MLDALKKPRAEQIVCRGKVAQQMMRDLLVNEDVAYEACDAFWDAIGGNPLNEIQKSLQETPPKALTSEEFWRKLVSAVKQDIAPPASGFFTTSPTAPLQGKLVGDCINTEGRQVTPVPGGVGLLTRCALMENMAKAVADWKWDNNPLKDLIMDLPLLDLGEE